MYISITTKIIHIKIQRNICQKDNKNNKKRPYKGTSD